MKVISGNTTGSVACQTFALPCTVRTINLVNRTAGAITVNLLINDGQERFVRYVSLAANEGYTSDVEIGLPAGFTLILTTSGSVDYYLTID